MCLEQGGYVAIPRDLHEYPLLFWRHMELKWLQNWTWCCMESSELRVITAWIQTRHAQANLELACGLMALKMHWSILAHVYLNKKASWVLTYTCTCVQWKLLDISTLMDLFVSDSTNEHIFKIIRPQFSALSDLLQLTNPLSKLPLTKEAPLIDTFCSVLTISPHLLGHMNPPIGVSQPLGSHRQRQMQHCGFHICAPVYVVILRRPLPRSYGTERCI